MKHGCLVIAYFCRYGGIYIDSDVIVLGSLSSLRNTLGMEDQAAGESPNGAVMSFEKKRFININQCFATLETSILS